MKYSYPFPGKQWVFLGLFQAHGKNVLIKNMVHSCAFKEKIGGGGDLRNKSNLGGGGLNLRGELKF